MLAGGEGWRTSCSLEFKLIDVQSDQLVGKKNKVSKSQTSSPTLRHSGWGLVCIPGTLPRYRDSATQGDGGSSGPGLAGLR